MLSVVITVFNEAQNLPRVLASVRDLADEVVVVDTESTDNSAEIAKKLGCRVFSHPYIGIVEPVRNFSITKARGDWVLLLDADEEISPDLNSFIRQAISSTGADYYRIPRKNLIFGSWIKSHHWWPDYVYRLFRKGYVTWEDTIHGIPQTRGAGSDFPADEKHAIIHHHYTSISQYVNRLNRYTDFQLIALQKSKKIFVWTDLIIRPFQEFLIQYFTREGFKDGIHGLSLAGLQSFSELVLYLKFWQSLGFPKTSISLPNLFSTLRSQSKQYSWWYYEKRISEPGNFPRILFKIKRKISQII